MEKSLEYSPQGVCSKRIVVSVGHGRIGSVEFEEGCHGNTRGIAALPRGMPVDEAIRRLGGIDCRGRGTSCPDQPAKALRLLRCEK